MNKKEGEKIEFNKVKVLTVPKVGSANFLHCTYSKSKDVTHGHNLLHLRKALEKESHCLIIVGVRNPIDRNLSHLFQSFNDKVCNDVGTRKNGYNGEYCYISGMSDQREGVWKNNNIKINFTPEKIIKLYFKKNYHNIFNDWFQEFLELTNISSFDKCKGLDFYDFPNNNTIMIYTMEKLSQNTGCILDMLSARNLVNSNDSKKRGYHDIYQEVKEKITYKREYLDNLLDTEVMRLFYNKSDIAYFYSKYTVS